eukprot:TRINITY_DN4598_c1_g2_i1.p1 TRINITY_DN4598_c1_g2~~TRINITY_DN4598_c1_g2_i1.p1  ORF type:complete len:286 (-),score=5.11 TRINITY_DN4598_c1_g2_i1:638-1495(-)
MWAMVTLDAGNDHVKQFLMTAMAHIETQVQHYTFMDKSTCLYALAYSRLDKKEIQPFFRLLLANDHLIPKILPQKVCGAVIALNAYAKAYKANNGKVPYTVRAGVGIFVYMINTLRTCMTKKDVVMTALGLAVFRCSKNRLTDYIRVYIERNIDAFNLHDSSNLLWSIGSLLQVDQKKIRDKRIRCCKLLLEHICRLLEDDIEDIDVRWITQILGTATQLNLLTPVLFLQLIESFSKFVELERVTVDAFLSDVLVRTYTILKSDFDPATRIRIDQSALMQQCFSA